MIIFVFVTIIRIAQLLNYQDHLKSHSYNFHLSSLLLLLNYYRHHLMFPDVQTMINLYLDNRSIDRQLFSSFFHFWFWCLSFTIRSVRIRIEWWLRGVRRGRLDIVHYFFSISSNIQHGTYVHTTELTVLYAHQKHSYKCNIL